MGGLRINGTGARYVGAQRPHRGNFNFVAEPRQAAKR